MTFLNYFLTAVLLIDCLFLVLLVLVQLPKKEAGMGQAFGGAATDALFGAGSGNVLTKATKWGAAIFFILAIVITLLGTLQNRSGGGGTRLLQNVQSLKTTPSVEAAPSPATPATPAPAAPNTNALEIKAPAAAPAK